MRTLYTLVITLVFCFSLFAVYNVGYERGKNKMVWENFREQSKRDSVVKLNYRKQKEELAMTLFSYGYTLGIMKGNLWGPDVWKEKKKDSIRYKQIFFK